MSETNGQVRYRCYCSQCDWEVYISGNQASAAALFGHGIDSGHAETYRKVEPEEWK